jgi:DNA-binding FrmR family transcriptional regulator
MKTRQQVTEEIERLMSIGLSTSDKKEKNRIRKRIGFLRSIEMYLEHSPTTETVVFQLTLTLKKIAVINTEFNQRYTSYCDVKTKREFMKGKGLPELTKQVKVLQYLLESK